MDYDSYIKKFQQFPNLGLNRIERLLENLNNPQNGLNVIHVAGTNGKGSVCAILYSVLIKAGYLVGRYLSPELISVNERISINGADITDTELSDLLARIAPMAQKTKDELGELPSSFEVSTAAAIKYFADKKCDYVILETGLGGRLDATNVCKRPLVSVITTIDIDHTEYLGDSIERIAFEKAGIIKEGVPCVSAHQLPDAEAVIMATCNEKKSPLIMSDINQVRYDGFIGMKEQFGYKVRNGINCGLAGLHQVANCVVALDVIDVLVETYGALIDENSIYEGIRTASNKARLEVLSKEPFVIFDGAHNLSGAQALAQSLKRYFHGRKFDFVIAMMKDKDCRGIISALGGLANRFIATEVPCNPRSMHTEDLCEVINSLGFHAVCERDFNKAIGLIHSDTVICGSLYSYKLVKLNDSFKK